MKRLILFLAGLVFMLGVLAGNVFAQVEPQTINGSSGVVAPDYIPPIPRGQPGFLGQDHSYSVTFRGNGEAVISLRVVLTNKTDNPLSEASLRIPKVNPENVYVYQVIRDKQCVRYSPQVYDSITRTYPPQECAEYQDPDYYNYYYGNAKYQKAEYKFQGDTLDITLPQPISSDKSGSYFVYFRAMGYTGKNTFGAYNYDFESLKVDDDIRNLTVGIDTDSDLFLKGVKGEVNYRSSGVSEDALKAAGGAAPLASGAIDTFYNSIGQGRIVKTASNLASLESYKVDGSYASSRLKLYGKEILIGVVAAFVVIFFAILIFKLAFKKLINPENGEGKQEEKKHGKSDGGRMVLVSAALGFVSAFIISAYTALVIVLANLLTGILSYQYNGIFVLFLVLISFGVYMLLLFGPGFYIGLKKGAGWGIGAVLATIIWLILFLGIAVLVIFLLGNSGNFAPIVPLVDTLGR